MESKVIPNEVIDTDVEAKTAPEVPARIKMSSKTKAIIAALLVVALLVGGGGGFLIGRTTARPSMRGFNGADREFDQEGMDNPPQGEFPGEKGGDQEQEAVQPET